LVSLDKKDKKMRTKPNKKIVKALVALATTGTVCVGAYSYYTVNNLGYFQILFC
jgi:hypothetical protein